MSKTRSPKGRRGPSRQPGPDAPDEGPGAFPIVGIGASAGGLAAFEAFFSGTLAGAECGLAFVLVQHLDPNHPSMLAELVQRYTRLVVKEAEDGTEVRPDHVYVIPPNRDLVIASGVLHLTERDRRAGHRLPIDQFFMSLALDRRERAICVVLSGTGADGTLGARAIKGEGGLVVAQSPDSAEFDGMPTGVIAVGVADHVLAPADMMSRIVAFTKLIGSRPLADATDPVRDHHSGTLQHVLALLRDQTGHDFSQYKTSTIHRRIERRMGVRLTEDLGDYVRFLVREPQEADALFRDLLIGVTSFFRDPDAFEVLKRVGTPQLLESKQPGEPIRVWCAGCSTGEEAYSLAILLQESMDERGQHHPWQIFATDIDTRSIERARAGHYPTGIASDVSEERLRRFFVADASGTGYRIKKGIRDTLIFSDHDLIRDPPFSRLDLISCRNLLIYLDASLQRRLVPLFHYALRPRGLLFLGATEGVGSDEDLFVQADHKVKLFRWKDHTGARRPGAGQGYPTRWGGNLAIGPDAALVRRPGQTRQTVGRPPLREMTEQALLKEVAAVAALVNRHGDVVYLHGRTGMYLEPSPGEAGVANILKMAREGLRPALTLTLRKVVDTGEAIRGIDLQVRSNGHFVSARLTVRPVRPEASAATDEPLYLVLLEPGPNVEERATGGVPPPGAVGPDVAAQIAALQREVAEGQEFLVSMRSELERANEDLRSSNEEMQSMNEELQSSNEELETSKEELQSVNEELATVNNELQIRVLDLSRANNDMNNLLAGTGIATLFLDQRLCIVRFTPTTSQIIHLIPSDVGRPVSHVASNLIGYVDLVSDVEDVLNTLVPKEREVQTTAKRWFAMRIRPYRTLENVIEGAVINFVDISQIKETQAALQKANALLRMAVVVRDSHDALTVHDLEGRTISWNAGATKMYGWSEAEALGMTARDFVPPDLVEALSRQLRDGRDAEVLGPFLAKRPTKTGELVDVQVVATALVDAGGEIYGIATTDQVSAPAPALPGRSPRKRVPR